jgi:acyl-CoA synthetase (AMP-forming)/AMP-acid ligase II
MIPYHDLCCRPVTATDPGVRGPRGDSIFFQKRCNVQRLPRRSRDTTILDRLLAHAAATPDKVIYTYLERGEAVGRRCTYAELAAWVDEIAGALCGLGYQGERALLLYANPLEFVEVFLGCLAAGVTAVPLAVPSQKNIDTIETIARNARIRCILAGKRELQLQPALTERLRGLAWHAAADFGTGRAGVPLRWLEQGARVDADRIAFLQYTSGSTGAPKGVMISHRNLMANEAVIAAAMRIHRDSVVVGWLPHYHDMGLVGNLLQTLYQGAHCVLMQPVDFIQKPMRWLRALAGHGGTVAGGPNFAYDLCVARTTEPEREGLDLRRWEVAFTGAEPVKRATIERFLAAYAPHGMRRCAIYPCYGMAESTLLIAGADQGSVPSAISLRGDALQVGHPVQFVDAASPQGSSFVSCGTPHADTRLAIVHPETGEPLGDGRVGEIWTSGASVARGYYGNPEATAQAFGARLAHSPDVCYLRTGDLGVMHDGRLHIVGRLKDILVVRGRNYAPDDIELTAQQASTALVHGAGAVFQCAAGDSARLVLVHELTRQAVRTTPESQRDIGDRIRTDVNVRHGIVLDEVVLIKPGELPRTTSGKVRRSTCRALYEAGTFAHPDVCALAED